MKIQVQPLFHITEYESDPEQWIFEIEPESTILDLKHQIQNQHGYPLCYQSLYSPPTRPSFQFEAKNKSVFAEDAKIGQIFAHQKIEECENDAPYKLGLKMKMTNGGCGVECCGCKWYGPCWIKEYAWGDKTVCGICQIQ